MTEHLDLSADIHGRVADYVADVDRRWFDAHPGEDSYERSPLEHETCNPVAAAEGRCEPLFELADGARIVVVVTQLSPGFRTRAIVERIPWGTA